MHLAVVGDTYTVLLSGEQTAGQFAMLDMLIPGDGPPPHRHDFEECFHVLEGSLEVIGARPSARPAGGRRHGQHPANARHAFRNPAQVPARLLCTAAPRAWKFFAEFGDPVPTRTTPAPSLSAAEREDRLRRAVAAAPRYGMEILPPPA